MTLPVSINDREKGKFRDTPNGPAIATVSESSSVVQTIINSSDRVKSFSWLDFGLATERISTVEINSPGYGTEIVRYTYNYTFTSGKYRLDNEIIEVI